MLRGSGPREAAAGQEKQIFPGPDERLQGLLHKGSGAVSCSQPRDKCHRCCTFRRSQAALQLYLQRDGCRCIGVSVVAPPPPPSLPPSLQQVTVSREAFHGCSSDLPILTPGSPWP